MAPVGPDALAALLAAEAEAAATRQPRVVLGIDGPDAAGKTTLGDAVAPRIGLPCLRASVDGFHHPAVVRHARPYEESFDVETVVQRLLVPFRAGAPTVLQRAFDYRTDAVEEHVQDVPERAILVLDGVFLHRAELRPHLDVSVYLDVPPDEVLRRARIRDAGMPDLEQRYAERYLPAQARYRPERPDLVVDNTDPQRPVLLRQRGVQG